MLSAIELNDELRCRTGEIDHVPPSRMLTTKSVREPELAQLPPHAALGLCHVPSQASGE
jgi:hypothetical protein